MCSQGQCRLTTDLPLLTCSHRGEEAGRSTCRPLGRLTWCLHHWDTDWNPLALGWNTRPFVEIKNRGWKEISLMWSYHPLTPGRAGRIWVTIRFTGLTGWYFSTINIRINLSGNVLAANDILWSVQLPFLVISSPFYKLTLISVRVQ